MTERRIEPEWAMVTVMFVDIRGFTTFADRATAREAVDLPQRVLRGRGPGRARSTAATSTSCSATACSASSAPRSRCPTTPTGRSRPGGPCSTLVDARMGERCRIGIGLNSGLVLVGTIGGSGYTELGVIGDPVNVAARVEDATRELGEPLLLTEATRACSRTTDPSLR